MDLASVSDPAPRKALITGGAAGFGLRIAQRLLAGGARVAVGDVRVDRLERAVATMPELVPISVDVREREQVEAAVEAAVAALGGLDTLVVSAGMPMVKPLEELSEADWDLTLAVNLKGAFLVSQAAAPALRRSGRGRIVFISSGAGRRGYPWLQAYCASKFGLIGLAESLASELAADGVTVNCVCPGTCPTTEMGKELTALKARLSGSTEDEVRARIAASYPLGRYVSEDDVAAAVAFLVSADAAYVTGATIDVAGGEHLGFSEVTRIARAATAVE